MRSFEDLRFVFVWIFGRRWNRFACGFRSVLRLLWCLLSRVSGSRIAHGNVDGGSVVKMLGSSDEERSCAVVRRKEF